MCAYQSAKKNFTREEIIEILKKNVDLYKGDPNFTSYIVDLALYLVEFAYNAPDMGPSIVEKQDMDLVNPSLRALKRWLIFMLSWVIMLECGINKLF